MNADRRLKMWEKIVVNGLSELSSVTGKAAIAGN